MKVTFFRLYLTRDDGTKVMVVPGSSVGSGDDLEYTSIMAMKPANDIRGTFVRDRDLTKDEMAVMIELLKEFADKAIRQGDCNAKD